jgi:hypothetical protein
LLGLFIQNGPGPHDEHSLWPFPAAKFTFYLYNQCSDSHHLTQTFDSSTEWKAQQTEWKSWGKNQAWTFQEIERSSNMYCKYVVEGDAIVIGCVAAFTKQWLF